MFTLLHRYILLSLLVTLFLLPQRNANAEPKIVSLTASKYFVQAAETITLTGMIDAPVDVPIVLTASGGGTIVYASQHFARGGVLSINVFTPAIPEFGTTTLTAYSVNSIGTAYTGSASVTISVGAPIPTLVPGEMPNSGNQPHVPISCGSKIQGAINTATGNAHFVIPDPVATRGYPLICNIHLNSQAIELNRPLLNATFSYDIHVGKMQVYDSNGNIRSHWSVIDGDGTQLDFGLDTLAPTPSKGIFSQLVVTGTGYSLQNAGPPENLNAPGNFNYTFDNQGRLLSLTDPTGNVQTLTYDSKKRLTKVLDINTNKNITFKYPTTTSTTVSEIVENGTVSRKLTYTTGRLTQIRVTTLTNIQVYKVNFIYNGDGLLQSIRQDDDINSDINLTYRFVKYTEASPRIPLANEYDAASTTNISYYEKPTPRLNNNAVVRVNIANNKGGVNQYDLDRDGNIVKFSLATPFAGATQALTTTSRYDNNHLLLFASDGIVSANYSYTANGLLRQVVDNQNQISTFAYNGVDLVLSQDPLERLLGVQNTILYENPAQPHVATSTIDSLGITWSSTHNAFGQTTSVIPPVGSLLGLTSVVYNETPGSLTLGYPLQATNGNGDLVTFNAYTKLGDLTSFSTYPINGNTTTKNTTKYTYDVAQRVTKVTRPDGKTQQYFYNGRLLSHTLDEAGTRYDFTFCSACEAIHSITGPLGWSLNWAYDTDKQLTDFTDSRGKVTHYNYGVNGELTSFNFPDNSGASYLYNTQGLLKQVTNPSGNNITYTYDTQQRLQRIDYPSTGQPAISLTYNVDDTIRNVTDGTGTHTYTYLNNGWLKSVTHDYSISGLTAIQELVYDYFPDGLRRSVAWKSGGSIVGVWSYNYDAGGRVIGVLNSWNEATSYSYDGESKLIQQLNANGTSLNLVYNQKTGLPTNMTYKAGAANFASYTMTYDLGQNTVGNLTKIVEGTGRSVVYTYDTLYRLLGETRAGPNAYNQSYGYDLAGNLTSLNGDTRTYDDANKLLTFPNGAVTHDSNGNISSLVGTNIPSGVFTWDDRDKLTAQSNLGVTINYGYDASGLRIWSQVGTNPKTFYMFDGGILLGELKQDATPIVAYTWGSNGLISQRIAGADGNLATGRSLWYAYGPQGETRQLTNDAGSITDTYLYTSYGVQIAHTGSNPNPFRFGGQVGYYTDSNNSASLILCTNRWYNPYLTRWMSRDPIGYSGGENLYAHTGIDPTGTNPPNRLGNLQPSDVTKALEAARKQIAKDNIKIDRIFSEAARSAHANNARIIGTGVASGTAATIGGGVGSGLVLGAPIALCGYIWFNMGQSLLRSYEAESYALEQLSQSQAALNQAQKNNCSGGTYKLVDPITNKVMYVGRTTNLSSRELDHNRDPIKRAYLFVIDKYTDNYEEQRGREQIIYDEHNPPLNKIRPISTKNRKYKIYIEAGK